MAPELDVTLEPARLDLIRHGAVVVMTEPAVFQVVGPGALACLQGLLTNDLVQPGEHSLVYGALLTPKGMIVVDYWVIREPDRFLMIAPAHGREASLELFRRNLPPRLATVADLTGEYAVAWGIGGQVFQALMQSGLGPLPEACARTSTLDTDEGPAVLALGPESAPFTGLIVGPTAAVAAAVRRLERSGATRGTAADLDAARILAGWPALGAEIGERTLPQEVRYDEIGGVSYTKGCYTGQETVARLHFRGHTNRELRGLRWQQTGPITERAVTRGGKQVGVARSSLAVGDEMFGLSLIRREVAAGDDVLVGGVPATVVALPFPSLTREVG